MSAEYATISAARQAAVALIEAIDPAVYREAKVPILDQDAKSLGHGLFSCIPTGAPAEPESGISGYDSLRVSFDVQLSWKLPRTDRVSGMDGAADAAIAICSALLAPSCNHRVVENAYQPDYRENWLIVTITFTDLVRYAA